MKDKAITMLGLAVLLLAVGAQHSFAQAAKQPATALVQPMPRPVYVDESAAKAEAAADTTLRFYEIRNRLFDQSLLRVGDTVVRAVGIIFEAPYDGAVDRVDFELSDIAPSPGVAGTGTLRVKLIELPFIVTDPPRQPGDSVDVDITTLTARGFVSPGDFANQIDVSDNDFEIEEGESYFLQLALVEESNDAALTFVFDEGSDDSTNTNYFVPPELGARTLVYVDSLGTQTFECNDPTTPCDDFVSLRQPLSLDTTFVHLNALIELQLSEDPPPPPPPPDAISLVQFVHNVPGVGMADIYVRDSLVVDSLGYREASFDSETNLSFLIVPAGEQTIDVVAAGDPDNSNPLCSTTVTLAENGQHWAVALCQPDQNSDIVIAEKKAEGGEAGRVFFVVVHGADGADPIDLNILDETASHALIDVIADGLAFGAFSMPKMLDASTDDDGIFNVEVAADGMQFDVFRLPVGEGGAFEAVTTLLVTSGVADAAEPDSLVLLTVDARGVVETLAVSTAAEDLAVPEEFALHGNFPNPFNPTTTIRFDLGAPGFTTLIVYNVLGQEVATLVAEPMAAGAYEMTFDASALPSGPYLYRLTSGGLWQQRMLMLVK